MGSNQGVETGGESVKACGAAELGKMREDFALVVADRKAGQGWSDADAEELGGYIAAAKSDPQALADWALYLAAEAAIIRRRAEPCRAAEARVRTERSAERRKEAALLSSASSMTSTN